MVRTNILRNHQEHLVMLVMRKTKTVNQPAWLHLSMLVEIQMNIIEVENLPRIHQKTMTNTHMQRNLVNTLPVMEFSRIISWIYTSSA